MYEVLVHHVHYCIYNFQDCDRNDGLTDSQTPYG